MTPRVPRLRTGMCGRFSCAAAVKARRKAVASHDVPTFASNAAPSSPATVTSIVGFALGAHEETALGAATGDHVATTRDEGAREGHAKIVGKTAPRLLAALQTIGQPW